MSLVPLKCTICGGTVSREKLQCEYCGAYFILKDKSTILPKRILTCPECGHELLEGSIVCLNCGKILTKNEKEVKKLIYLQSKIRESQAKMKGMASKAFYIGDDEYIFGVYTLQKGLYVITDKRLLAANGKGATTEIRYEDIVQLHIGCEPKLGIFQSKIVSFINAETFKGYIPWVRIEIPVIESSLMPGIGREIMDVHESIMQNLWTTANLALQLSEKKIQVAEVIFYHLKLKE